jgi:metal-responsive CopG/Arc/MetJ family transcriptional regulator
MKTAISIPDDVFAQAEKVARLLKKSRSEIYSEALRESANDFRRAATRETLRRSGW